MSITRILANAASNEIFRMKRSLRYLCLLLLAAGSCCSPGCLHPYENPSYFPYLHSTPYANYDPFAVRLVVEPPDRTNPVRMQHVIIATIYDKDGTPRRGRRIEWRTRRRRQHYSSGQERQDRRQASRQHDQRFEAHSHAWQ